LRVAQARHDRQQALDRSFGRHGETLAGNRGISLPARLCHTCQPGSKSRGKRKAKALAPDGAVAPAQSGSPLGRTSLPVLAARHIHMPLAPDWAGATSSAGVATIGFAMDLRPQPTANPRPTTPPATPASAGAYQPPKPTVPKQQRT